MRGYAAVGLVSPKSHHNVGAVLRAAYCYSVALVCVQGERANIRSHVDTLKAYRHIPVMRGNDLHAFIPYDAVPVAIERLNYGENLFSYVHPPRAFYIFGPEDGSLGYKTLSWCRDHVYVPTKHCMNLAATVNVVLYDRALKDSS